MTCALLAPSLAHPSPVRIRPYVFFLVFFFFLAAMRLPLDKLQKLLFREPGTGGPAIPPIPLDTSENRVARIENGHNSVFLCAAHLLTSSGRSRTNHQIARGRGVIRSHDCALAINGNALAGLLQLTGLLQHELLHADTKRIRLLNSSRGRFIRREDKRGARLMRRPVGVRLYERQNSLQCRWTRGNDGPDGRGRRGRLGNIRGRGWKSCARLFAKLI